MSAPEPTPNCCEIWPELAPFFRWYEFENWPGLFAMPLPELRRPEAEHGEAMSQERKKAIAVYGVATTGSPGEAIDAIERALLEAKATALERFAREKLDAAASELKRRIRDGETKMPGIEAARFKDAELYRDEALADAAKIRARAGTEEGRKP